MSAANWAEVLQKVMAKDADADATAADLLALGLSVEPVTEDDGLAIARWWVVDHHLSLGDRCCLALAERLAAQAVTADGTRRGGNYRRASCSSAEQGSRTGQGGCSGRESGGSAPCGTVRGGASNRVGARLGSAAQNLAAVGAN